AADPLLRERDAAVVVAREHAIRARELERAVAEDACRGEVAAAWVAEQLEDRVAAVRRRERGAARGAGHRRAERAGQQLSRVAPPARGRGPLAERDDEPAASPDVLDERAARRAS